MDAVRYGTSISNVFQRAEMDGCCVVIVLPGEVVAFPTATVHSVITVYELATRVEDQLGFILGRTFFQKPDLALCIRMMQTTYTGARHSSAYPYAYDAFRSFYPVELKTDLKKDRQLEFIALQELARSVPESEGGLKKSCVLASLTNVDKKRKKRETAQANIAKRYKKE